MSEVVRLTVVPDAAQVAPGDRLSLALTLQHTGHTDGHYRLEVSGVPADWYDLDPPRVALLPAASAQVLLTMHPPAGAVASAGRYTLTVQVRAEEDPAIQAATVVALTVSTGGGVDMDVQPVEAVGRQGVFRITYLNQLNWPVYVVLTARDHENGLRFRIEPETPVVVPATGVAGPVTVHVVPKVRALLGTSHPYEIEFQAVELGGEDESTPSLVRWARFVYVPRYAARRLPVWLRRGPGWALLFPLALLLLLLAFAGSRTLASPVTRLATTLSAAPTRVVPIVRPTRPRLTLQGRTAWPSIPSIRRFRLVQRRWGQPYALLWQARGATQVTLDGRPVPARGSLVLQAPLHSATYRLAATTGARHATAHLHIVVDARTTDAHAVVLTTPDIATFAVRHRDSKLYAIWLVRNAVHVWLQGRLVAKSGDGLLPPGTSWLRLVASNAVGSRQRLLHLARPVPTATPRPTATPTPLPTVTPTAHPSRPLRLTTTLRPTWTPTPPPSYTPTPPPTVMSTVRLTRTPMPSATAAPTRRPTAPIALGTMVLSFITTPPPFATVTSTPSPVAPTVVLSAHAVDFGRQRVGTTSAAHTVDVVNLGPTHLTITSVAIMGNDAGDFAEADMCAGVTLSTYDRCTISVRFTPLTSGTRSASVVLSDNGAGGSQNMLLSGGG